MRRTLLLLVVGLIQTMLFAETAWAQGTGFLDDFTYFDATRWSVGDHRLGRSYLDPANVSVDGGNLRIKLPARTLEGGENLMLNTWFPAWLDGKRPKRTTYTYVVWIQHTQSSESGIPAS